MKKIASFLFLGFIYFSLSAQNDSISYEDNIPTAPTYTPANVLQINGNIQTDNRFNIYKNNKTFSREEYRLSFFPEYKTNRTAFKSELWVRTLNFPTVNSYTGLSDKNLIQKIDFDIREAYFDVYDFLISGLDLRVGRQRIAWGTADRLNPTDNLNPYDLEDIWDFGRHLGSNSLKLSYYLNDFTFSGVFIPTFTPSLAPDESLIQAFMPEINFPSTIVNNNSILNLKYNNMTDSLMVPSRSINNTIFGLKIEIPISTFNTSISYMYGRDVLPAPQNTTIKPVSLIGDTLKIDILSQIVYPRMKVIGADLAGSLWNIGVWAEAALFMPEKITNTTSMSMAGNILMQTDSVTVDNKPYIKVAAGFDYTFSNGWYLNTQYLHGFIHEKGKELTDYYVVSLRCPLFRNKITLSPANACLQIKDYKDLQNNYAFVFMPEISYQGIDNVNFIMGLRLIEGSNKTAFGKLRNNDEVFMKLKYSF